jgi:Fe-Mn family superoxide dismutase
MKNPDDQSRRLSRREAVKALGQGVALVGAGLISARSLAAESPAQLASTPSAGATAQQPFSLPKLDYSYAALEPHIDARTMEIHHTKHHQAYITNANKALADYPALQKLSAEEILRDLSAVPEKIRGAVRNNVGGHFNHSLFWKNLSPNSGGKPTVKLEADLAATFGSLDAFKTQFTDAAMKRFGSGWSWLVAKGGKLSIESTANQDSPVSDGATPLLGLDVWEHAYYLHYQNRRADYVAAFWNVVNWADVSARYGTLLLGWSRDALVALDVCSRIIVFRDEGVAAPSSTLRSF